MPSYLARGFLNQLANGDPYRLWQAITVGAENPSTGYRAPVKATGQAKDGRVYVEVPLPSTARALKIRSSIDIDYSAQGMGFYPKGSLAVRLDPNIAWPAHMDRITLTTRYRSARINGINRTAGNSTDKLKHPFISQIQQVRQFDQIYVLGTDYQLVPNTDVNAPFAFDSINWIGSKPADNTSYGISYLWTPYYNFLSTPDSEPMLGLDNLWLPITGVLDQVLT